MSRAVGGMSTPRVPSEIADGDGADVLDGKSRVMNKNGEDVTEYFIKGRKSTKDCKNHGHKESDTESKKPVLRIWQYL